MHEIESWLEEKQSTWLYHVIAEVEAGESWATLFERLAEEAEGQARIWADGAAKKGGALPAFSPTVRARVVAAGVRLLGARAMQGALAAMKVRGLSVFRGAVMESGHSMPVRSGEGERRHRDLNSGGALRAAVFGANDGLVSNASLILGVAGAAGEGGIVLLTGVAGLLAGAFSMASGEYVSVRSQRELLEYQLGLEKAELAKYPAEEATELALIYEARGMPIDEAQALARRIISDPEAALQTLAREELGLDPTTLGSPWTAALSSFLAFAVGATVPLLPWLLLAGTAALPASVALTALALFVLGAALSLFTGRGALYSGARMLTIGGAACTATFGIGHLLGVRLS